MNRSCKNEKGVITVFVSLLLVSVLTLGTFVIEAGRLHSARAQLSEVNISAASSVLSNYDFNLYQRYGILAYKLDKDTKARFQDYMYFDSDLDSNFKGNNATCLYDIKDAKLTGFYNLTYPSVLKRQILSKSKYLRSSYAFVVNFNNLGTVIESFNNKYSSISNTLENAASQNPNADYVTSLGYVESAYKDLRTYDESAQSVLSDSNTEILPSTTEIVEDVVPKDEVDSIQAVLDDAKQVVPKYASSIGGVTFSTVDKENDAHVSINYSSIRQKMAAGNVSGASGLAKTASNTIKAMGDILNNLGKGTEAQNNLLLNSYLTKHCPNRAYSPDGFVSIKENKSDSIFVKSFAEYLYGGKPTETENQDAAYWQIFYFRLCDNLNCIVKNYSASCNDAAKVLWAYYESLIDMTLLTDFKTSAVVPLTKTKLFLPIDDKSKLNSFNKLSIIDDVLKNNVKSMNVKVNMMANDDTKKGELRDYYSCPGSDYASYTDYISITLWFVSNAEKLTRLSDLIQLEMRHSQSGLSSEAVSFKSQDYYTYCRVEAQAQFRTLLPVLSIDNNGNSFSQASFSKIKYVGY